MSDERIVNLRKQPCTGLPPHSVNSKECTVCHPNLLKIEWCCWCGWQPGGAQFSELRQAGIHRDGWRLKICVKCLMSSRAADEPGFVTHNYESGDKPFIHTSETAFFEDVKEVQKLINPTIYKAVSPTFTCVKEDWELKLEKEKQEERWNAMGKKQQIEELAYAQQRLENRIVELEQKLDAEAKLMCERSLEQSQAIYAIEESNRQFELGFKSDADKQRSKLLEDYKFANEQLIAGNRELKEQSTKAASISNLNLKLQETQAHLNRKLGDLEQENAELKREIAQRFSPNAKLEHDVKTFSDTVENNFHLDVTTFFNAVIEAYTKVTGRFPSSISKIEEGGAE